MISSLWSNSALIWTVRIWFLWPGVLTSPRASVALGAGQGTQYVSGGDEIGPGCVPPSVTWSDHPRGLRPASRLTHSRNLRWEHFPPLWILISSAAGDNGDTSAYISFHWRRLFQSRASGCRAMSCWGLPGSLGSSGTPVPSELITDVVQFCEWQRVGFRPFVFRISLSHGTSPSMKFARLLRNAVRDALISECGRHKLYGGTEHATSLYKNLPLSQVATLVNGKRYASTRSYNIIRAHTSQCFTKRCKHAWMRTEWKHFSSITLIWS